MMRTRTSSVFVSRLRTWFSAHIAISKTLHKMEHRMVTLKDIAAEAGVEEAEERLKRGFGNQRQIEKD